MSVLATVIATASSISFVAWLRSVITGDSSQVDRLWSIVPEIYLWIFAGFAHLHNATLNTMAILGTLWGARLTFNFARKGGYSGVEDYRWEILRNSMTGWQYQLFNIFFITIYQNFLLVLITLPAYYVYQHPTTNNGWLITFAILFLLALIGEFIADQQQWDFHKAKAAGATDKRFCTTGLFTISRHPNFFFEQAQWWILYLMGAFTTAHYLNLSIVGAVLLTALFIGSTRFTEQISLSKYPEYREYQRSTAGILPWIGWRKR